MYLIEIDWQLLSRAKPVAAPKSGSNASLNSFQKQNIPDLKEFIANRDFTGAIALLQVFIKSIDLFLIWLQLKAQQKDGKREFENRFMDRFLLLPFSGV